MLIVPKLDGQPKLRFTVNANTVRTVTNVLWTLTAICIVSIALTWMMFAVKHPAQPSRQELESTAAASCKVAVRHVLRDPDSAQFEDVIVVTNDNGSPYEALATVRAKNGFGGYGKSTFKCEIDPANKYTTYSVHEIRR